MTCILLHGEFSQLHLVFFTFSGTATSPACSGTARTGSTRRRTLRDHRRDETPRMELSRVMGVYPQSSSLYINGMFSTRKPIIFMGYPHELMERPQNFMLSNGTSLFLLDEWWLCVVFFVIHFLGNSQRKIFFLVQWSISSGTIWTNVDEYW